MIAKLIGPLARLGVKPDDPEQVKQEKNMIVGASIASGVAALIWGLVYFLQGEESGGAVPLLGATLFFIYLPSFSRTGNIARLKFITFLIWLFVPSTAGWLLGGFNPSSVMIIWSFIAVILALTTSSLREASRWFLAYLLLLAASGLIQPLLPDDTLLSDGVIRTFYVLNLGAISVIIYLALRYFITQRNEAYSALEVEQQKSNNLLLNVLPQEIAEILKESDQIIAQQHEETSVLFADLVGFTPLSEKMAPVEMILLLNEIYSNFDQFVDQYGVEKIRTIGDNYMVVSGAPRSRPDHARAAANLALDMVAYIRQIPARHGHRISFRIGINSGPLIAGVIGERKFHYDVWGDTVNTASRMESHGVPGMIQVTEATRLLLKDEFEFEPRGEIEVKGKGKMQTWFLVGRRAILTGAREAHTAPSGNDASRRSSPAATRRGKNRPGS